MDGLIRPTEIISRKWAIKSFQIVSLALSQTLLLILQSIYEHIKIWNSYWMSWALRCWIASQKHEAPSEGQLTRLGLWHVSESGGGIRSGYPSIHLSSTFSSVWDLLQLAAALLHTVALSQSFMCDREAYFMFPPAPCRPSCRGQEGRRDLGRRERGFSMRPCLDKHQWGNIRHHLQR